MGASTIVREGKVHPPVTLRLGSGVGSRQICLHRSTWGLRTKRKSSLASGGRVVSGGGTIQPGNGGGGGCGTRRQIT